MLYAGDNVSAQVDYLTQVEFTPAWLLFFFCLFRMNVLLCSCLRGILEKETG